MTHLHEASEADRISANADRVAAELIALLGKRLDPSMPDFYEELQTLVSVAYLRGASDELKRVNGTLGGAS